MKPLTLIFAFLLILLMVGCQQGGEGQETTATQETTTPLISRLPCCGTTTAEEETTTEPRETQNPVAAQYETVAFENFLVLGDEKLQNSWSEQSVFLIGSADEWHLCMGEEPIPYDESCFEEKAIVVMNVRRSSSEEIVELTGIAIKNDMLYPVLTMTHGEDLNLDILNTALIAKIDKTALSQYTAGELLIINAAYPNRGSQHHTRFE